MRAETGSHHSGLTTSSNKSYDDRLFRNLGDSQAVRIPSCFLLTQGLKKLRGSREVKDASVETEIKPAIANSYINVRQILHLRD